MLKQDPNLPSLDMAWSRRRMTNFFNRRVMPGQQVTSVARGRATYEPGKQCAVLYSLNLSDEPPEYSRLAVVTFAPDDSLHGVYVRHYAGKATTEGEGATLPLAVSVPEHRCLVEFFPFDWRLPSLARAANQYDRPLTTRYGRDNGSPAACPEVRTLHYVPHRRCVLQTMGGQGPRNSDGGMVIKVYPPGPQARQTRRMLARLQPQATASGMIVPRPLEIEDTTNLVLMEPVPGTSLKHKLKRMNEQDGAKQGIRLAAAALATLHGFRIKGCRVRSFDSDLEFLRKEATRVHVVAPSLAQIALTLLQRVAESPLPEAPVQATFIHGDFMPSQLLVDEERVAVVDFDNACLGDPAMDVGNFMAKLHRTAVRKGHSHHYHLAQAFLAEYVDQTRDKGLERRALLYQVISLVRAALHTFQRAPRQYASKGRASLPVLLLQEAARCLAA